MTRYIPAFSWGGDIEKFLKENVIERPVLNVCCGKSLFGNVRMDQEAVSWLAPPDVIGDMEHLPFDDDSFGCVFTDPPWDAPYKEKIKNFMLEAFRVAPVVYTMSPWVYGSSKYQLLKVWVRQHPGINNAILLCKYQEVEA